MFLLCFQTLPLPLKQAQADFWSMTDHVEMRQVVPTKVFPRQAYSQPIPPKMREPG